MVLYKTPNPLRPLMGETNFTLGPNPKFHLFLFFDSGLFFQDSGLSELLSALLIAVDMTKELGLVNDHNFPQFFLWNPTIREMVTLSRV